MVAFPLNREENKFFFYAVFIFIKRRNGRYTPEVGRASYACPSPVEESNVTLQRRRTQELRV